MEILKISYEKNIVSAVTLSPFQDPHLKISIFSKDFISNFNLNEYFNMYVH